MKVEIMKKLAMTLVYTLCISFWFHNGPTLGAESINGLQRLDAMAENLATAAEQLEELNTELSNARISNTDYDQQKNVFLAAVLTVSTVAAICSYESELLTLFTDLRPQNRRFYIEVRRQSLQASIGQLEIMHRQMKISENLLKIGKKEKDMIARALGIISAAMALLHQADDLVSHYAKAQ